MELLDGANIQFYETDLHQTVLIINDITIVLVIKKLKRKKIIFDDILSLRSRF